MSEHQEQVALFQWAAMQQRVYPDLALLHAIPNGGQRHVVVAKKLKDEGVKAGVPDISLPVPRGGYHGLYIEMKYGKNKTSEAQDWWIGQLREQGHRVEVCYSWLSAQDALLDYLELPDEKQA